MATAESVAPRPALASEREVLDYLAGFGVPVIPVTLTRSAEQAAAEAARLGGEVVLKIASPDIGHKTEVGGVRLGLSGADAVRAAWLEMDEAVRRARPDARIDGILVCPMRRGGLEIFVGTARDPDWGMVLVTGLGGIWVDALQDTSLRVLPITREDAVEMLTSLRAARLLSGFRGAPAADLDALADAIVRIGDAALGLGADAAALEVNPLRVAGSEVEALDGLVVWNAPAA